MEIGQKVKVKLGKGFVFTGIYSDNIPNSENILIQGDKMRIITKKSDCVLAEHSSVTQANELLPLVSNRIYTVVDQDGDLINCWKNKEDAEKHAEDLRKKHGTHFEATEEPLF